MNLKSFEEKYHITFPTLFHQLSNDNMLSFGESCSDWSERILPSLMQYPPFLLFGVDYEPLTIDEIEERYLELKDPNDYRKINPEMHFVPFAKTGGGDLYAFYICDPEQEASIVLLPHDEENATILAKNLQDFTFRCMLEAVTEIDEDSLFNENPTLLHQHLKQWLHSHTPYLSKVHMDILQQVFQHPLPEDADGLLTEDEFEDILNQEIDFDQRDTEFKFSAPHY